MVETFLLEAIDAFARRGTLTAAAEELHLTQPTLTRSMRKLEAEVGVPLFEREARSIRLNECGELVAERSAKILEAQREMVGAARALDRSRRGVAVAFSDAGPMVELAPMVARMGGVAVTTEVVHDEAEVEAGFAAGRWQVAVLPRALEGDGLESKLVCTERLTYGFATPDHPTDTQGVRFADIDGKPLLVLADIGMWRGIIERMLPNSRLIDEAGVDRLSAVAEHTELAVLGTDIGDRHNVGSARSLFGRTSVPFLDDEAEVAFFATCRERDLSRNPSLARLWAMLG
ncbi:MAG: LysR family transcriptional regulator [Actinomycetota bacterium]|nr:LysR family transcriptional regulator [Actinomycetota bacterium]